VLLVRTDGASVGSTHLQKKPAAKGQDRPGSDDPVKSGVVASNRRMEGRIFEAMIIRADLQHWGTWTGGYGIGQ
jgi:hypothetical protein